MTTIIALYLYAFAVVICVVMLMHHRKGEAEIFSVRNVALIGLIIFQCTSAAVALLHDDYGKFYIHSAVATSIEFSILVTAFFFILLWAYRRGWGAVKLARRVPYTDAEPRDMTLLMMAFVFAILGAGLRFGVQIPLIGIVAAHVGLALAAVSCGLVGWVWGKQMLNPVVAAYSAVIMAGNLANAMAGTFGRRTIVAMGLAMLWGMYYSHWRYSSLAHIVRRSFLLGLGLLVLVALFTSVRTNTEKDRTAGEQIEALKGGNVLDGLTDLLNGQGTGVVSMWHVENFGERFDYDNLVTLRYFFLIAIPRDWWPDKPVPTSNWVASRASISGVSKDVGSKSHGATGVSLSPGIIGHAVADGGWPVVVLYAVLLGLFLRFFDEIVALHPHSPFMVLAVGSSLGQMLGLFRGETSAFAFIYVVSVFGSLALLIPLGRVLSRSGSGSAPLEAYSEWDEPPPGELETPEAA